MLEKGAIELVSKQSSPGFYSRLFAVPKPSGGFRPILDLSNLNKFLRRIKFKMESAETIRRQIRPSDWACSLDLKDAYFHIRIHQSDRKWLRFTWRGKVYQYRSLPFGLSLSPWAFTRVVRDLLPVCRKTRKIRFHTYLDDWLVLARNRSLCHQHTQFINRLASLLGFVINEEKSDLSPSQEFSYLGMEFNTKSHTVGPSQARIQSIQVLLSSLDNNYTASPRMLTRILGKMESLAPLLHLGRLHKRPLQRKLKQVFSQETDSWNKKLLVRPWLQDLTVQWRDAMWLHKPVPIKAMDPQVTIFTDASEKGWGAHMGDITAEEIWPQTSPTPHINNLELEAVYEALLAFQANIPQG